MIEVLRKPPPAFADVIRRHFWIKRDEICLQIERWINETKEFAGKNVIAKTLLPQQLSTLEVGVICLFDYRQLNAC